MERGLVPSRLSLKRARQRALTVLEFFNREPFFKLRQILRDEFGFRQRAMTFPIQRGIEPTNMEACHCYPQRSRRLGNTPLSLRPQDASASAKERQTGSCDRVFPT